jgi:hypothetical protein
LVIASLFLIDKDRPECSSLSADEAIFKAAEQLKCVRAYDGILSQGSLIS